MIPLNTEDRNFICRALERRADVLKDLADCAGSAQARESLLRGVRRHLDLAEMVRLKAELVIDSGVSLISEERRRQIDQEGFDLVHDDAHVNGELTQAALYYLSPGDHAWPWDGAPTNKDRVRSLTIAAAFIAAEIDRVKRADAALK